MSINVAEVERFADKPIRAHEEILDDLEQTGEYIAELKIDGWRGQVFLEDGGCLVASSSGKNLPLSDGIIEALRGMPIKRPAVLDIEWADRRKFSLNFNRVYLLDILKIGGNWLGEQEYSFRRELLEELHGRRKLKHVYLTQAKRHGFKEFFEYSKTLPWTEGLVIKHLDSTIIGNPQSPAINSQWVKVKWRD